MPRRERAETPRASGAEGGEVPCANYRRPILTYHEFFLGVAIAAFALAALTLALTLRVVRRRRRAGQPQRRGGLAFRVVSIATLVALGVTSLVNLPPPELVNRPAPSPASDTVVFLRVDIGNSLLARTIEGVSARDGATRWTRALDTAIYQSLLHPQPDLILAHTYSGSVYALRMSDGATLWTYQTSAHLDPKPTLVAADGTRAYVVTKVSATAETAWEALALDLRTGALLWRTHLLLSDSSSHALVVGDGLVAVADNAQENNIYGWRVQVLRATDGALQWTTAFATVVPHTPNERLTLKTLLIARGNVFVAPEVGPLAVLRGRDGAVAWSETPNLTPDYPPSVRAMATDGAAVYVMAQPSAPPTRAAVAQTTLMALDPDSGAVRWRIHPPTSAVLPPIAVSEPALAVSGGVLLSGQNVALLPRPEGYDGYYPQGSLLTAYDATTGKTLWRDNTPPIGVSWDLSSAITPQGASGVVYLEGIQADPFVQDRFNCLILCPGVTWLYAVNARMGAAWWRIRSGYHAMLRFLFVF